MALSTQILGDINSTATIYKLECYNVWNIPVLL